MTQSPFVTRSGLMSSPSSLDTERTIVLDTFANRRDAEHTRERLAEEDIKALVSADDAGGLHLDLQHAHGVVLRVLEKDAEAARHVLARTDPADAPDDDLSVSDALSEAGRDIDSHEDEMEATLTFSARFIRRAGSLALVMSVGALLVILIGLAVRFLG